MGRRAFSSLLKVWVVVGLLEAAQFVQASPAGNPELRILFPEPGEVINSGTIVLATISPDFSRDEIVDAQFEFSRDGINFLAIVGVAPIGAGELRALWDTDSLESGSYVLRVRLVDTFQQTWFDSIVVHVNQQPALRVTAVGLQPGLRVQLDARRSLDNDGRILSYRWDFGDGGTEEGPVVEHVYARRGVYGVSLTATDDQGGVSTRHFVLAIASPGSVKFKEKDRCGCVNMAIKNSGEIDQPQSATPLSFRLIPGIPPAQRTMLGPYNDGQPDDQLDMRKAEFQVRNRLEIVGELAILSNPKLCREGQRAQGSWTIGQNGQLKTIDLGGPGDPNRNRIFLSRAPTYDSSFDLQRQRGVCPLSGANWCDDDYHGGTNVDGSGRGRVGGPPNGSKGYDRQARILWIDAPGFNPIPKVGLTALPENTTAMFKAKFEAEIVGDQGCQCSWEVNIEINRDGRVLQNQLTNVACSVTD